MSVGPARLYLLHLSEKIATFAIGMTKDERVALESESREPQLGENNELKNRHLHVRWEEVNKTDESSQESSQERADSSQEMSGSSQESSQQPPKDNRDRVLSSLRSNPTVTLQEIADKIGITRRGVQKITDRLKADGIIRREGSTKAGKWIINTPD